MKYFYRFMAFITLSLTFPFFLSNGEKNQNFKSENILCIYIYNGPGVSPESLLQIKTALKNFAHLSYLIKEIEPSEVISGKWTKDAALFIMPGGADIPYCKSLSPQGNKVIRAYVEEGGFYLGICAGAYYGAENIVFASGTPLEVIGKRDLSFFPGRAEGPVLAPYDYKVNSGARVASVKWLNQDSDLPKNSIFPAYFNGGCYFVEAHKFPEVTSLASYVEPNGDKNKVAILVIKVGKGRALLSGVHFEYDPELMDKNDPYLKEIRKDLLLKEKDRAKLLRSLFKHLEIKTR